MMAKKIRSEKRTQFLLDRLIGPIQDDQNVAVAINLWKNIGALLCKLIDEYEPDDGFNVNATWYWGPAQWEVILFDVHSAAVNLLVEECERNGIECTKVLVAARYCRKLLTHDSRAKLNQMGLPFPEFLDGYLYELPQDVREAIASGCESVERLRLRLFPGQTLHNLSLDTSPVQRIAFSQAVGDTSPKRVNANAKMLDLMIKKPESESWTVRQFAEELRVSTSTISDTIAWKSIMQGRNQEKESRRLNSRDSRNARNELGQDEDG